jgi:NAD(P)-dependent dehydrogenase (short-subunit alcohol dehydrogenase family)
VGYLIFCPSAGAVGPRVGWLNTEDAPEKKDVETFGNALFNDEGFDGWASLYKINTFSVYYVTSAMLGLLDKGSKDFEDSFSSSVVNITSISGITKLAQNHVCRVIPTPLLVSFLYDMPLL